MEDLNKNQLVLLALLVSFVSSVATSIMTYSLLSEAPQILTQTINRVVERTVETVTPAPNKPNTVTKIETVVVQEEDLLIEAIAKNEPAILRIWLPGEETPTLAALATLVKSKIAVTSRWAADLEPTAEVKTAAGHVFPFKVLHDSGGFLLFLAAEELDKERPAALADSDNLRLGQTVISVGGREKNKVLIGRITGLSRSQPAENLKETVEAIETDLAGPFILGQPLINLKGELVGLNIGENFLPVNKIKDDFSKLPSS